MSVMKSVVRFALIAGLVGGAAVVVAGPDRVGAILNQTRGHINGAIDKAIDDPIALRSQLRSLEAEYPARIEEVRGDLAELRTQKSQIERDLLVSRHVVELTTNDLSKVKDALARAEEVQAGGQMVRVVFQNQKFDMKSAYAEASKIGQVRQTHSQRMVDLKRDLGYLEQQESRLAGVLDQLEAERDQFQTQMVQLDGQVDSIARNDRLIALMQKREATIAEHSRYRAASLDQVAGRLSDIRARQEAQLESFARANTSDSYENRAKLELDNDRARLSEELPTIDADDTFSAEPTVIEVGPNDNGKTSASAVNWKRK